MSYRLLKIIAEDAAASGVRGRFAILRHWLITPGFRAVVYYRLAHALAGRRVPMLPALLRNRCLKTTGADLSPGAKIGPGLVLPHPVGVVIGGGVLMGNHGYVFSGVVLGQRSEPNEWPVIGNEVHLYTGSKVLGSVRLGDRCRIGANAVVLRDVPADATAVGIPATVCERVAAETESVG